MAVAFRQCESHHGRPLANHLLDVASRIRSVRADDIAAYWIGLFHDLGKATRFFQTYLNGGDVSRALRAHSRFGATWLLSILLQHRAEDPSISAIDLALAHLFVRRHHGRLDDLCDSLADSDAAELATFVEQIKATDVAGVCSWLRDQLQGCCPMPDPAYRLTPLRVELTRSLQNPVPDLEAMRRFQDALSRFGVFVEADRDSAAGYAVGEFNLGPRMKFEDATAFRAAAKFGAHAIPEVTSARELVYETAVANAGKRSTDCGHLWSLTVPTGSGKTLAATGWALKRREIRVAAGLPHCPIIYALPFTSIIDQNAAVLRSLHPNLPPGTNVLAVHHHLTEVGELDATAEESLARSWVEGWRSDIVCTTFVQIVNALFHGTPADAGRFSRLAGSILILDEVQAIPAELWPACRVALESLSRNFGTDILLVTATQPALFADSDRFEIAPPPSSPDAMHAFDRYDIEGNVTQPVDLEDLATLVYSAIAEGDSPSCLVVLNTVQEALDLYSLLRDSVECSGYALFHLSTNLRPKDRHRILAEISNSPVPHILVATQVVEAGVDISFDVVFRALAPLDSIVQAAGRCNRHGTGPRGRVIVFRLQGASDSLVYGDLHLDVARRLLVRAMKGANEQLPEPDIRSLVVDSFSQLADRVGKNRSSMILQAVRQLEFAALRGEGESDDRDMKQVQLIRDEVDRVPHFVETDPSDVAVWQRFLEADMEEDSTRRRRELRKLRGDLGQRIVEVPRQYAVKNADSSSWVVHVPFVDSSTHYDTRLGWKR